MQEMKIEEYVENPAETRQEKLLAICFLVAYLVWHAVLFVGLFVRTPETDYQAIQKTTASK